MARKDASSIIANWPTFAPRHSAATQRLARATMPHVLCSSCHSRKCLLVKHRSAARLMSSQPVHMNFDRLHRTCLDICLYWVAHKTSETSALIYKTPKRM